MKSLLQIRKEREYQYQLTLKELSSITKVTEATLSRIERGLQKASLKTRIKIETSLDKKYLFDAPHKVNWLDVPNLDLKPIDSTWNDCERQFYTLYKMVKSLPYFEKSAFIKSVVKHLLALTKRKSNKE